MFGLWRFEDGIKTLVKKIIDRLINNERLPKANYDQGLNTFLRVRLK